MWRRRSETVDVPAEPAAAAPATGKGRPTPKRDASRRPRAHQSAPLTRKEAYARRRETIKDSRRDTRQALATGDERRLPARDAGPARRLARDMVDARANLAGLFMPLALCALGVSFVRSRQTAAIAQLVIMVLFTAFVADSILTARRVRRRVTEEHGAADARGVGMYAAMRASTIRRLRMPPPKVKRGEQV